MFQKILVALDRNDSNPQVIQKAFTLAEQSDAKLAILHIISLQDASTVLLLSELDRQKNWASTDLTYCNAWGDRDRVATVSPKLNRLKTKLKVAASTATLEPLVFNHFKGESGSIATSHIAAQARSLGSAIVDVAHLCKADLIVLGLAQPALDEVASVCYDVIPVTYCPVLIVTA